MSRSTSRVPAVAAAALLLTLAATPLPALAASAGPPHAAGAPGPARSTVRPHAAVADRLLTGQTLLPGQAIASPSGRWTLTLSTAGALLLQQSADGLSAAPPATAVASGAAGDRLVVQADGNVVLYGPDNTVYFATGTSGSGQRALVAQDDGNVVLYDAAGAARYATGLRGALVPGQTLLPGEQLVSHDGDTRLLLQADGNLVLYTGGTARFATGTFGPVLGVVLQDDGNLVLYTPTLRPLFSTGTSTGRPVELDVDNGQFRVIELGDFPHVLTVLYGSAWGTSTLEPGQVLLPGDRRSAPGGIVLIMQTDGNLVEYIGGRHLFSTGTRTALGIPETIMQNDGNVVVYDGSSGPAPLRPLYNTHTAVPGSHLTVQYDGNVVVYTPQGQPVFDTADLGPS